MKLKAWEKLEQYICNKLQCLDKHIKRSPGSGNGNCKGDVKFSTNLGLHIEAKQRNLKSVYDEEWLIKCESEIPLHSDKIAIVVTENKEEKKRVHLDADDFFDLYIKLWRLEHEKI